MRAPQILLIVLYAISLLASAYLHGKPKEGNHNILVDIVGVTIIFSLLWWGGFFNP